MISTEPFVKSYIIGFLAICLRGEQLPIQVEDEDIPVIAEVIAGGRITIPEEIRKIFGVKDGDHVMCRVRLDKRAEDVKSHSLSSRNHRHSPDNLTILNRVETIETDLVPQLTLTVSDPTKVVDGFREKSILVIGDLIVDRYVHSQGRKLSREAPVPVADFISEELVLGGASNLTNNLVALGAKVKVLGVVGKDEAGRWLVEELQKRGVDTSSVIVNDRPTSLKTRFILNHRQYLRIDKEYRSDVEPHITKQFLGSLTELVKSADGVVFSDYDKGGITPDLISNVVEECRVQDKKILAQPKVRHYLDYIGVTMVKSNAREGSIATGVSMVNDTSLRNMGHNLMSRLECESLLLTRSERGMILFEKRNITSFPPFKGPKPGFNAVGVRDCMTAVLAMSLASDAPVQEAVLLAGLAAAQQADEIGTVVVDLNELQSQASTTLELAEHIVQVPVH